MKIKTLLFAAAGSIPSLLTLWLFFKCYGRWDGTLRFLICGEVGFYLLNYFKNNKLNLFNLLKTKVAVGGFTGELANTRIRLVDSGSHMIANISCMLSLRKKHECP